MARSEPLDLSAAPVQLQFDDARRDTVGALRYLGGFAFKARDPNFGGLSGLVVNGEAMTAVTDRGYWVRARLISDEEGRFRGLADTQIAPILSSRGETLRISRGEHDAEAIEIWNGAAAVSFERFHRIGLYPVDDGDAGRPTYIDELSRLASQPANDGIETLVALDGPLMAISEGLETEPGRLMGWLVSGDTRATFTYPASNWKPTDGAYHPAVGVLILERRFSGLGGFSARIRRIDPATITDGATLDGDIVARFVAPTITDNFEGLAISETPDGQLTVWLMSDDNFSFLQRNLLLAFRWIGD